MPTPTIEKSADIRQLLGQTVERAFTVERAKVDLDNRTVEVAFSSETPVENWFGYEILDHSPDACDLSRLNGRGAVLVCHDRFDQVGVTDTARIDKDRMGRALVRFSRSDRGTEIMNDVNDGIRTTISVRYIRNEMILEKDGSDEAMPTYRTTKWTPLEISFEPIPADEACGVGRTRLTEFSNDELEQLRELLKPKNPPAPDSADVRTATDPASITERNTDQIMATEAPTTQPTSANTVAREIIELGDLVGLREFAVDLSLEKDITIESAREKIAAQRKASQKPTPNKSAEEISRERNPEDAGVQFPYSSKPRFFKGATTAEAARKAYRFGKWLLAGPLGDAGARQYCQDNGIPIVTERTQQEGNNVTGGFLVPHEFGNDMIDLKEEYGDFRKYTNVVPMAGDTKSEPRRQGGLVFRFVGESEAGTSDDLAWGQVLLSAKKGMCLARISSELNEDSLINTADRNFYEMAYAQAVKEDDCGFNGDGTATYGGMVGVRQALKGLSTTIANIAGLVVASGTGYATNYNSIVLGDLNKVKGRLPKYAIKRGPRWFMSQTLWAEKIEAIALAGGGVTSTEIANGAPPRLLGYPVEICQAMPSVSDVSQVAILFGALDLASMLGDRRQMTFALSEHSRFANDEIELRGTARFDINVHDVGNASATASARVPGPVVGLITAAS